MTETRQDVWQRIKDTHLVRWVGIYGTGAIMALTLVDFVREPWGLSDRAVQLFQLVVGAGFPTALVLAWYHGEKGRQKVSASEGGLLLAIAVATVLLGLRVMSDVRPSLVGELAAQGPTLADPDTFGIAVLPFVHLGPDEREVLTRAIHGEVTDGLAQISALTVIDRSTVFAEGVADGSAREVAADLGVRYLLYGEIQWTDRQLLLNARLVDGPIGAQIGDWEVPAFYAPEDVFAIQASIAGHVARAVEVEILPVEEARLARVPTADALAMDEYLQAMANYASIGLDVAATRDALGHLEAAVARDPSYGEAWARLAHLRGLAHAQHRSEFPELDYADMVPALEQAEEHAPDAPETIHARAAHTYWGSRDFATAERQLTRLTREVPNWSDGHFLLGLLLRRMNQWERALAELDAATMLDPRGETALVLTGEAYFMAGRFGRAAELLDRLDDLGSTLMATEMNRIRLLLWGMADTASAIPLIENARYPGTRGWMTFVNGVREDLPAALAAAPQPNWQTALLHRELGDLESMHRDAAVQRGTSQERLERCPPPDVPDLCRQEQQSLLGLTAAVIGDTATALAHLDASEAAHARFHDGYHSTVSISLRAAAYVQLGMWEEAHAAYRELLSAPSFMHEPMLRIALITKPLRENHPPFLPMLDSMEARGPLY